MTPPIPDTWKPVVGGETEKPYFQELQAYVDKQRAKYTVFPPEEDVYNALKYTPYDEVKALLLGQDPYHDDNQAHGLCFSVRPGITPPPSLRNVFKELHDDVDFQVPNNGYLVPWAKQEILMLNSVLTVRAHEPASHKHKGWEVFTDAVIRAVNDKNSRVVFLLWGNFAQNKAELITNPNHVILKAAHPSPLSAKRGFFGCRHFSKTNKALKEVGKAEIDWQIPDLPLQ